MTTRREFLQALAAGAAVAAYPLSRKIAAQTRSDPWREVPRILARIKPPVFPSREFDITKFGGVGNNVTDNTDAFREAIAACTRAGGGRVVVPVGEFVTGAIELKRNVNLHVSRVATLAFSQNPQHYLPAVFTRFRSVAPGVVKVE